MHRAFLSKAYLISSPSITILTPLVTCHFFPHIYFAYFSEYENYRGPLGNVRKGVLVRHSLAS